VISARSLRHNMTEAEKRLWTRLRNRQIEGARFRRQAAIGTYIADFACFYPRIVIEVDGGQHAERQRRDERRTSWLENEGFVVLRFWNNDVLANGDGVV